MNLEKLCFDAIKIIKPVGKYIKRKRKHLLQNQIVLKSGVRDFVTQIDKNSEKKLVKKLSVLLPEAGFITEEKTTVQINKLYKWIIDPLDGTMNYIHGIPVYAISVALTENDKIVLGIVYEIVNDELFYTWKNAPAYCNGKQIKINQTSELKNALIATGFPYERNNVKKIAATIEYFLKRCRDIRRLGSAATDLCYVACGRMDAYYEGYLSIWDIAAGIIIVKNAGGVVTDFDGKHNYTDGKIIASNKKLYPYIKEGIQF